MAGSVKCDLIRLPHGIFLTCHIFPMTMPLGGQNDFQAPKTSQHRADGGSYPLLRPTLQASGAMFTTYIAQRASGEV